MRYCPELKKAIDCLNRVNNRPLTFEERQKLAIELASRMLSATRSIQNEFEEIANSKRHRFIEDKASRNLLLQLTDQCFRSQDLKRIAEQISFTIEKYGIPISWTFFDRLKLLLFQKFGQQFPSFFVPTTILSLQSNFSPVVKSISTVSNLTHYLRKISRKGYQTNVNMLGEEILGESQAMAQMDIYLSLLKTKGVDCISVKISSVFSQISTLSHETSLDHICERLRQLYQAAIDYGKDAPKFVYLDMESFHDLDLTVSAFIKILSLPKFHKLSAGIALQAYLPDSYIIQQRITEWALTRVKSGGQPIKIRLVKGANLNQERITASHLGWENPVFREKIDVDANFKRMLHFGINPKHTTATQMSVASHNLFELAYAMILNAERRPESPICYEMLKGMNMPLEKIVMALTGNLRLYCPVTFMHKFHHAIAYLSRRLDENTTPENFLSKSFSIQPGTLDWEHEVTLFMKSCAKMEELEKTTYKHQNRQIPVIKPLEPAPFCHESLTDITIPANREWAEKLIRKWRIPRKEPISNVIDGTERDADLLKPGFDPSNPFRPQYFAGQATPDWVDEALLCATEDRENWAKTTPEERNAIFEKISHLFRTRRADLIGAIMVDAAKPFQEADAEVSEAIDFIDYYRHQMISLFEKENVKWMPSGPTLIAPPWNFPCAIAAGQISASLLTGNTVILKPSPESVLIGSQIAKIFWDCGVSKKTLQFII
ncbi:MAG: RHH-type proline utilization regulon transcriptional repressor/proline dehydrogenase, partial [Candidatus Marinamargulisbacteria bacterium]